MKKQYTYPSHYLTAIMLYCVMLLSACNTSRFAANGHEKKNNPKFQAFQEENIDANNATTPDQDIAYASASAEETSEDVPAAAHTKPDTDRNIFAHPPHIIRTPVASTVVPVSSQEKAVTGRKVVKKLSLPARMLMKSIVKKADKLQKKDIKASTGQKEVNNSRYLVIGIVLLAAGLVLALVGQTTFLYILASVATLAGLILLLLAIL